LRIVWGDVEEDATVKLTSSAFEHEKGIPEKYTADGDDISPPLEWAEVPGDTRAFALLMEDPDAPAGTWVHWLLYDLPHTAAGLPENIIKEPKTHEGARQGRNDFGNYGYGGPAPPPAAEHRYVFELLALDAPIGLEPGASRQDIQTATEGHVLAIATLTGRYSRRPTEFRRKAT
jgi:hypothetical protein